MPNLNIREVSRGRYDDRGYSNEESLANLMLSQPVQLSSQLTYLYGKDNDKFPLSFLTEGQGQVGVQDIHEEEWTWPVMGRMRYNDAVLYFDPANTTPGKGGAIFEVEFRTHWLIEQYGLMAPDNETQVRIMKDCGKGAHGGYRYKLQLTSTNPNVFVDPALLQPGMYWTLTAPTISASYSKGNRTNTMGPGTMKSQLEYHRFSKEIGGNMANLVVSYEFEGNDGSKKTYWINEEMRQFDIQSRIMEEERMWFAEYNRKEDGSIALVDFDNGKPIPHTAGMRQICREANYDTYGEFLTLNKIKRTIGDVLSQGTETPTEVVLFCGKGFAEDFDDAIRQDAINNNFATPLGEKMISEANGGLSYGNYFRQYKTIDNVLVTLKYVEMFDKGTIADNAKANGMIHPKSGLPITSHQAYLVDFSTYEGQQNVKKIRQVGCINKVGVLKGISDVPASWGALGGGNQISQEVDASRYEVKDSFGLQVFKNTNFMHLECKL